MNQLTVLDIKNIIPVECAKKEQFFLNENNEAQAVIDAVSYHYNNIVITDAEGRTEQGRKELKKLAALLNKDIAFIDNAGKEVVTALKAKPKVIDGTRKMIRDSLTVIYDQIRAPVVEYEAEQARIKAEAEEAERKRIEALEAENARLKAEAEQKERDERIKAEAAEKARLEAQLELQKQQREASAEIERKQQELEAKEAEIKRQERARIEKEKAKKEAEAKRLDNIEHVKTINNKALNDFIANGIDEAAAKNVIKLIFNKKISNISINY